MNNRNEDITDRAKESPLWADLSYQEGRVLPYMLERYLLLENWKRESGSEETGYLHLLLADACVTLLGQEERLRKLEESTGAPTSEVLAYRIVDALGDAGFLRGSLMRKEEARKNILETLAGVCPENQMIRVGEARRAMQ